MGKNFLKNVTKFSFPTIMSALVAVFCIPFISHVVPADDFAVINLFFDYGVLFALLSQLGMGDAFLRFYNETTAKKRRRLFTFTLLISLSTLAIIGLPVATLFPLTASKLLFGEPDSMIMSLLLIYTAAVLLYKFTSQRCRLDGSAFQYNIEQITYILANRVAYVLPLLLFGGIKYALIFMCASTLIIGLISLGQEPRPLLALNGIVREGVAAQLFKYGLPTILLAASTNLFLTLNKVLLANLGSLSETGIFALSLSIANCFSFIPAAFSTYWVAYVYESYQSKQNEISQMHDCVMVISSILVCLIFMGQDLIYFLVGSQYASSQPYFMLVMLLPVQLFISETTSYGINLSKKTYLGAIATGIALTIDGLLCIVCIPRMGALGAAVAFAVGAIVLLLLRTVFAQQYYRTIANPVKFLTSLSLIVFICSVNTFAFDQLGLRAFISIAFLATICLLYRSTLKKIINYFLSPGIHASQRH